MYQIVLKGKRKGIGKVGQYLQKKRGRIEGEITASLSIVDGKIVGGADSSGHGDHGDVNEERHEQGEPTFQQEVPARTLHKPK